jgi:quinol-cytochrome oxidoreductase complex cytochrome b subunit
MRRTRGAWVIFLLLVFLDLVIGAFIYRCYLANQSGLCAAMGVILGTLIVITLVARSDLD